MTESTSISRWPGRTYAAMSIPELWPDLAGAYERPEEVGIYRLVNRNAKAVGFMVVEWRVESRQFGYHFFYGEEFTFSAPRPDADEALNAILKGWGDTILLVDAARVSLEEYQKQAHILKVNARLRPLGLEYGDPLFYTEEFRRICGLWGNPSFDGRTDRLADFSISEDRVTYLSLMDWYEEVITSGRPNIPLDVVLDMKQAAAERIARDRDSDRDEGV